ncbi:WD repeat-containing protein 49 isoform X2 [Pantherophis guttatus]|uniref:WD repeat-containing protein 49 isoform X2 n=1 Tax=Pantherophis guttatus TaxID=94885 RepID=A0ABM3YSM6_PANGU|nr:WD repeat-containing protein 49 isoform X2 [Pantherophis guttatus]
MNNKPYKTTKATKASAEKQAMDCGTAKKQEHLENRLTIHDFMKMQQLFQSSESSGNRGLMTRESFVNTMSAMIKQGTKEEYGELFDKIDLIRDGLIDWDKLTSFVLLELYERDERTKMSVIPQWKDLRFLPTIHKDVIQNVICFKHPSKYLTVSRNGLLGVWGESLKLQKMVQITTEAVKPKDLWVTSLVALPNVNKVAVAFTNKEIHFAELNFKKGFSCQYRLQGFEGTVTCMHYWYNPHDGNEAILSLGDVCGQVQAIVFNAALISLFERPPSSFEDENVTVTINWQELVSGYHKCCHTLRHKIHNKEWIKQATAGINCSVCLWNPYVTSKPAGILTGHSDSVIAVQFITERKLLFSFAKDKILRLWDIQHQLCMQRIAGSFPKSVDFHSSLYFHESQGLLFISMNNQLMVLEMEHELGKRRVASHKKAVTCLLYNSVLQQVISSDTGSTVIFWLIDTGQKIKEFTGCHGNAEISTMALDGTETRLFTGGTDGTVKVWDFNGYCHHKLNAGRDQTVEISQILVLSWTILVLGWDRVITVFRLNNLTQYLVQPSEWKGGAQHKDDILCAAFLPPQTLVTGSSDGEIVLWNNSTENAIMKLSYNPGRSLRSNSGSPMLQNKTSDKHMRSAANSEAENCNAITRLVFLESRNISATGGANLISCGGAGWVRFWNTQRSKLLAEFEAHSGVGSIIMTTEKQNQYLITADLVGWLKIWDIEDYCLAPGENIITQPPALLRSFQAHEDCITSLESCWQNNCLFIVTSSTDHSIVLMDISGTPFGIFGQEEHWRIGNHVPSSSKGENDTQRETEKNVIKNNPVQLVEDNAPPSIVEQIQSVAGDKDNCTFMGNNIWENTILGKKFQERPNEKGKKYSLSTRMTGIKPSVVFRSLKIEALKEITETNELELFLHPDKYSGEKLAEKSSKDLKLPTFSATLKAAFDEKNLFPKEILDREKRSRQLQEEMCPKDRITSERKQGKVKRK